MSCVKFDCAKCGTALECYVNTGSAAKNTAICDIVRSRMAPDRFCSGGNDQNPRTVCEQQCSSVNISCFEGVSYGLSCPEAADTSTSNAPRCMGGAGQTASAELSNLASYQYCGDELAVTCVGGGKCIGG